MKRVCLLFGTLCMAVFLQAQDTLFVSLPVPDSVFQRMQDKSYPEGCTVPRSDLRYLRLSYRDAEGHTQQGEMVCNRMIAADLVDIFRELWRAGYRIGKMRLVDDYEASDLRSMEDNNTSCFCYRRVAGTQRLSKHAQGMAVDINPLYNPHVILKEGRVAQVNPPKGRPYSQRRDALQHIPYIIQRSDLCCRLFRQHGFRWGGDWRSSKDYQHFER